ncbi:MAG: tyrosine-type recombinase/integrase [Limimaricola sp.]|uniref:tyrosine-type recombinase/integrase n=1 Tax=Limimaricola sp. TaxID=2211665 RepID=UPI001DAE4259|nr:site-specific integrase [Limimaricola sp.]MBI1415759.1 tyrosine-type recombinase/integrase [Limimaricola sp.]
MARITKRLLDAAQTPEARQVLWDDTLKGYGVILRPSGVHSFVFSYRNARNRKRNITVAKVGTIAPELARRRAEEFRAMLLQGRDPLEEKQDARDRMSVGGLIDAYCASPTFRAKRASTQYVDHKRIDGHLRPLLGGLRVDEVTMPAVEKAFRSICEGRHAGKDGTNSRVRGGEGIARSSIRLFRAILNWGYKAGSVEWDAVRAARNVEIGRDGRREIILEDPAAYARLWPTLDRMVTPDIDNPAPLLRPLVADAIRLIALTGARRGEIAGLQWRHVDLAKGLIVLPPDRHKTGGKTGEARVIGLPALEVEILRRQPGGGPDEPVFPPLPGHAKLYLDAPWRKVRLAAGLPAGIGLHGLRHTFASYMAMQGAQAAEIMAALGHKDMSTSQRYIHWANDRRQALAERAAATITGALTATEKAA